MKAKISMKKINYDHIESKIQQNYDLFMAITTKFLQKRRHYVDKLQSFSGGSIENKKVLDQIAKRNAVRFGQMYLHSDSILTKLELLDSIIKKKKYAPNQGRRKPAIKNKIKQNLQQLMQNQGQGEKRDQIIMKMEEPDNQKQIKISDLVSWEQNSPIMNADYFVINSDSGFLPEPDPPAKQEEQMMEEPRWANVFQQ